jgi:hypothetical protein
MPTKPTTIAGARTREWKLKTWPDGHRCEALYIDGQYVGETREVAAPEKTAQLSEDQRKQMARLFGEMPFMGGAGLQWPEGGQTGESLLYNLTVLRDELRKIAVRFNAAESEASLLRRERLTIRSFLGLDEKGGV